MIIRLKTQFVDKNGGTAFRGDKIRVDDDLGEVMINRGMAEPVAAPVSGSPATAAPVTKPVAMPADLKGTQKLAWLRRQITARGAEPCGNTVATMAEQLRGMQ